MNMFNRKIVVTDLKIFMAFCHPETKHSGVAHDSRANFSQLIDHLPYMTFYRCVERYNADHRVRTSSCWDQFLCLAFAQLTYREGLRDIESCLKARKDKLYHMGIKGNVTRSNLADANERRDWRIYVDFARKLITTAQVLYAGDDFALELKQTAYALDSTTIDLCLPFFSWALFRQAKGAIKLHTLLNLHGSIPTIVRITTGKVHDVKILDTIIPEPGAIYVMDCGYLDFTRLHKIHRSGAFFVIRAKKNIQFRRHYHRVVDKAKVCGAIRPLP